MQNRKTLIISAAILIVILLPAAVPFRMSYSFSTYGQVIPVREWVLMRADNGMVVSVLRDNATGTVRTFTLTQVERGEALSFSIAGLEHSAAVTAGDTVAWTTSTDVEYSMASLRGSLAVAEAALDAARAGEKVQLVDEAERRLTYARKALEEHERPHLRTTELYREKLVSNEEYELSKSRLDRLRIDVSIASAQLATVSTGARDEEVRQRIKEISAINGEIDAMSRRLALSTYVAPISGVLRSSRAADTLLTVEDTTGFLLVMPVRLCDCSSLDSGAQVEFHAQELSVTGEAHTLSADSKVHYFDGQAMVMLTARITACPTTLPRGLITTCKIASARVSLFAYLKHLMSGILE